MCALLSDKAERLDLEVLVCVLELACDLRAPPLHLDCPLARERAVLVQLFGWVQTRGVEPNDGRSRGTF